MKTKFISIHHVSFIVSDLQRSLAFYEDMLGLERDLSRPDMGFTGAWLKVGANDQIHLLQLPNPDPVTGRPEHGGRDRHAAFSVTHLDNLKQLLVKKGIAHTMSKSGRAALFFRDPDGNALELIEAKE
jgi:glyoxylase I family protein